MLLIGLLLLFVGIPSTIGWVFAALLRATMARGTRGRYMMASFERTLRYPALIARTVFLTMEVQAHEWGSVAFDVFGLALMVAIIIKNGDEDDFWTGKGKKFKKRLRESFSGGPGRLAPMPT